MLKRLFFLSLFLKCQFAFAQDTTAIRFSKLINPEEIKSYLQVLSSDSLEGRETGKPGQKKAAAFISKHFSELGLKPISHGTFFQDHPVSVRSNKGMNIEVNQQFFLFMKDYYYMNGYSDTMIVMDTIVFAGYGIQEKEYNDYEKINVAGKPIMIFEGEPEKKKYAQTNATSWSADWKRKLAVIYEKKPSIVFIVTDSIDEIIDSLNYSNHIEEFKRLNNSPTAIPVIFIRHEMAYNFFPEKYEDKLDKSKNKIDRKGSPKSFVSKSSAIIHLVNNTNQLKGQNVIGFLEGTDKKEEALVITAHYDHLGKRDSSYFPGADDDGSGTSAVMELAKVFSQASKSGYRPRRSVLFMTVSGEEKGLLGSAYYSNHPVFPLSETVADLNIDMIGRTDEKHDSLGVQDYVYIIGSDKLSTELHRINENANATYTKLELDYTYNKPGDPNRFYYRSDHYNFAKYNVPIIFYFNGAHKDYHRITDTIDKINFDLLAKRAQLVFFTAWEVANREERIKVDVKNEFEKEEK